MATEIRMCIFCEHCDHEEGYMVSEVTGWQEGSYSCNKKHFYYGGENLDDGWTLKAMNCPDYNLKKEIQKIVDAKK